MLGQATIDEKYKETRKKKKKEILSLRTQILVISSKQTYLIFVLERDLSFILLDDQQTYLLQKDTSSSITVCCILIFVKIV
jgi:hypothetical protein